MQQVRIIDESDIDGQFDASIKGVLVKCFPKDADVFSKSRGWHGSMPLYSVLIENGGEIIAHAGIVDRVITIGGKEYRAAGVQNVCVVEEFRGGGLSKTLLDAAMEKAGQLGFDFGLLFGREPVRKVYSGMGWKAIEGQRFVRIEDGAEIELPAEKFKMYWPLGEKEFAQGEVNLQGNDW